MRNTILTKSKPLLSSPLRPPLLSLPRHLRGVWTSTRRVEARRGFQVLGPGIQGNPMADASVSSQLGVLKGSPSAPSPSFSFACARRTVSYFLRHLHPHHPHQHQRHHHSNRLLATVAVAHDERASPVFCHRSSPCADRVQWHPFY